MQAFSNSFDLDQSQKELILKVIGLLNSQGPDLDHAKANRWVELGDKYYKKHPSLNELKNLMGLESNGSSKVNGNNGKGGCSSSENSPDGPVHQNLEESLLWSNNRYTNQHLIRNDEVSKNILNFLQLAQLIPPDDISRSSHCS